MYLLSIVTCSVSYSQEYTPMLGLDKSWNMFMHEDVGNDGYPFDFLTYGVVDINGVDYYPIYASHADCETLFREDIAEKKVYAFWEGEEYVLFDFSKEVGETHWLRGEFMEVTAIGYGDFFGMENLRYLELNGEFKLIEGIGMEDNGITDAYDIWCLCYPILEYPELVGINNPLSIDDTSISNLSVSPNPVHDRLFVNTNGQSLEVELFTLSGQSLKHETLISNHPFIDMSQFQEGIYILVLSDGNHSKMVRIVKDGL